MIGIPQNAVKYKLELRCHQSGQKIFDFGSLINGLVLMNLLSSTYVERANPNIIEERINGASWKIEPSDFLLMNEIEITAIGVSKHKNW